MNRSLRFNESDMSLEFCLSRGTSASYMEKATYDADGDGIVDNAARLGGYLPSDFAKAGEAGGGITPHIGENDNWFIGKEDTGVCARGTNGITPHMDEEGFWWIGETYTGVNGIGAPGMDGIHGHNGEDGITPHIGENGNWWIGGEDTGVCAGGSSMANVGNALKGTATGKCGISLMDVSPVDHEITVQTRYNATLMTAGANLFDTSAQNHSAKTYAYRGLTDPTQITVVCMNEDRMQYASIEIEGADMLVGSTVTLSAEWEAENSASNQPIGHARVAWVDSEGVPYPAICELSESGKSATGVVEERPMNAKALCVVLYGNYNGVAHSDAYVVYQRTQLQIGEKATAYEAYKGCQYYALDQQCGSGLYRVKSISPCTSIVVSHTANISVEEYHRDINKALDGVGNGMSEADKAEIVAAVLAALPADGTPRDRGEVYATLDIADDEWYENLTPPLEAGKAYYLENKRFIAAYGPAGEDGYVAPPAGLVFDAPSGVQYYVACDPSSWSFNGLNGAAVTSQTLTFYSVKEASA